MAFDLGFDGSRLRDDAQLGYRTGAIADFVVVDEIYADVFVGHTLHRPPVAAYVKRLLDTEYRKVYDRNDVAIYERVRPSVVFRFEDGGVAAGVGRAIFSSPRIMALPAI
jgi:hypothetical protein